MYSHFDVFLGCSSGFLTSMTYVSEEQYAFIGVHKALGVQLAQIAAEYLIYALARPSLLGAVIGIACLSQEVLPGVIISAYGSNLYCIPNGSSLILSSDGAPLDFPV